VSDHYAVLGVDRGADAAQIKAAYRRMARQFHPDHAGDDPEAEARFKQVSHAYEVLSDPERRRRYDTFGDERAGAGGGGRGPAGDGGLGDLFDAFFGGSDLFGGGGRGAATPRGADSEVVLELDLAEAAFGVTRTIEVRSLVECDRCDGSGCEPGTHPNTCVTCGGAGQVRELRRSLLGQMVMARPCATCSGTGQVVPNPCTTCRGEGRVRGPRQLDVPVPAGIADGQRLRLSGRGQAAPRGGLPGDLFVRVVVRPHPLFEREGDDLVHRLRLPMVQLALGAHVVIETLDGAEDLVVPAGTQHGQVFRLAGRGVTRLRGGGRGDVLVVAEVVVPERLSRDEAELLRHYAELRGEDVAPAEQGLFSRIRSAFQ
jgi:molecular chaperone DnaJ